MALLPAHLDWSLYLIDLILADDRASVVNTGASAVEEP
jgi:hypothetical protein